jgi:hypothetical protein
MGNVREKEDGQVRMETGTMEILLMGFGKGMVYMFRRMETFTMGSGGGVR